MNPAMNPVGIAITVEDPSWTAALPEAEALVERMALAALAMGGTLWAVQARLEPWLTAHGLFERLAGLVLLGLAGFLVYALLALALGLVRRSDLGRLRRRKAD